MSKIKLRDIVEELTKDDAFSHYPKDEWRKEIIRQIINLRARVTLLEMGIQRDE